MFRKKSSSGGGGQAACFPRQLPGVFGVITMPTTDASVPKLFEKSNYPPPTRVTAKTRALSRAQAGRPIQAGPGRRRTYRKSRGGNDSVKYTPLTTENIKKDVESAVSKSPGVKATIEKLKGKKGGRRRTFRKKKTLREVEKKLDELKKLISQSS